MTSSRLKLYVSITVIISHILTFFSILGLRAFVLPDLNFIEVAGSVIPLFGVFVTTIIKDTLKNRLDLTMGAAQSTQMVAATAIMLGYYVLVVTFTILMILRQTLEPQDLPKWLAVIEAAFGTALGLIIDDLFGGSGAKA